jgi:hypothetical protein
VAARATLARVVLWVALLVGGLWRIDAVPRQYRPGEVQGADVYRYYVSTAENFLAGKGWTTDYEWNFIPPPLQAAFVVAVKAMWPGADYQTMRAAQAVVGILTIWLVYLLGCQLAGPLCGAVAALLLALDPDAVWHVGVLLAETNHLFLLLAFLAVLLVALGRRSPTLMAASGLLLGLASLARPAPWLLVLVVPSWLLVRSRASPWLAGALLFVAGYAAPVVPWIAWNHARYGHLYPISSNAGTLLAQSNFLALDAARPDMTYWDDLYQTDLWQSPAIEDAFRGQLDRFGKGEWNLKDRAYAAHALRYIAGHPLHFARNYVIKLGQVLTRPGPDEADSVGHQTSPRLHALRHLLVLPVGLLGLALFGWRERKTDRGVVAWAFAYLVLATALLHITRDGRMSFALRVLLGLFAAYAVAAAAVALAAWHERHGAAWLASRLAVGLAVAAALLVLHQGPRPCDDGGPPAAASPTGADHP